MELVFLWVHEGIDFIAHPFSNLSLAIFEKAFQGNSLVRAERFIVFVVGKPCWVACCLLSMLRGE